VSAPLVEFRRREPPLVNASRHRGRGLQRWEVLWAVFFEGAAGLLERLDSFDHISCDKYWFISEPYNKPEDVPSSTIVQHATRHGAKAYVISPGYYHEDAVTIIIVPFNLELFKQRVNEVLDKHTRYEASIRAPWGDVIFDKSAVRRFIRRYNPPPPEECFRQAMDYLTWRDIIKPQNPSPRIEERDQPKG